MNLLNGDHGNMPLKLYVIYFRKDDLGEQNFIDCDLVSRKNAHRVVKTCRDKINNRLKM